MIATLLKTQIYSLLFILSFLMFTSCGSLKKIDKIPYDSFMASQKSFVSKDGVMKYLDQGKSDKVILLIHGVPTSSWLYRKMIPLLVQKGYRVVAPDMLGFGNSDSPKGYDIYNDENHALRIIALMEHLDINNWHHVMHDAGGLWTWQLIKAKPKAINKLTVLNTIIYPEGFHPPIKMKEGLFAKIAMWSYRNGITTKAILKKFFNVALSNPNIISKSDFYGYKKPLRDGKTKGMYYFFTQTGHNFPDYSSVFSNLEMPVQFIWGEHDTMLQIKPQSDAIYENYKIDENQIYLLDATHLIQEEKPEKIVNIIDNF